jgi:hypothetical protein
VSADLAELRVRVRKTAVGRDQRGDTVRFGLFWEMYVPPLDLADPGAEARIVRETVDQIVFADKHGRDYAWLTEHHFPRQFSHMSALEVQMGGVPHEDVMRTTEVMGTEVFPKLRGHRDAVQIGKGA